MGSVKFEFTTRDADLEKSYRKMERENTKLRGDLDKVKRASHDSSEAARRGMAGNIDLAGRLTKQIGSIATSWFTATQAIAVYNRERQRQIEMDNQAKNTQLTVAQAEAALIKNFGDAPATEINSFIKSLEKVNTNTKFGNLPALLEASATTISATGGNRELTRGLLSEAAGIFRDDPTQLPVFASALGDVAKIIDAKTEEDFKKAMGLVLSTQSVARIENLKAFENVAPTLANVANLDTTGRTIGAATEGAALFAAIGGSIGDKQGAITKTAVSSLATQLRDFLPETDVLGPGGSVIRKGTGMRSLAERITAVQNDVELQRQFFHGDGAASFPIEVAPQIEALLMNRNSPVAQAFAANQTAITPDVAMVERLKSNLERVGRNRLSTIQSHLDTVVEGYDIADEDGARRALVREAYDKMSQRAAPGWMDLADRMVARGMFETSMMLGRQPERAASEAMYSMNAFGTTTDPERYNAVFEQFTDIMAQIEVNTRSQRAVPDQMNSQRERE